MGKKLDQNTNKIRENRELRAGRIERRENCENREFIEEKIERMEIKEKSKEKP